MKKYGVIVCLAVCVIMGSIAALENDAIGLVIGILGALSGWSALMVALVRLDAFDFPEDSRLEAVAQRLQKRKRLIEVSEKQPLLVVIVAIHDRKAA